MPKYDRLTDPTSNTLAPQRHATPAPSPTTGLDSLRETDLGYLMGLVYCRFECKHATAAERRRHALEQAGLRPTTEGSVRVMHSDIVRRIDQVDDAKGVLRRIGLGISTWAEFLADLYASGQAKYIAVALRAGRSLSSCPRPGSRVLRRQRGRRPKRFFPPCLAWPFWPAVW